MAIFKDQSKTLAKLKEPMLIKLPSKKDHVSFTCSFSIQVLHVIDGELYRIQIEIVSPNWSGVYVNLVGLEFFENNDDFLPKS